MRKTWKIVNRSGWKIGWLTISSCRNSSNHSVIVLRNDGEHECDIINREKIDSDAESGEPRYRFGGSRRRRHSLRRRSLFTVFSNCNKTPLCSEFAISLPPRRQREKGSCISLRFSAGDDGGDYGDDDDELPSKRCSLTAFFLLPLCPPEWKLDPLLVPLRSLVPSGVRARFASRDWNSRGGLLSPTT